MKEAFFCHDGKDSNFRRIQLEKFIKDAHSASELKVKLNYFSHNDHNFTMEVDNPYNTPVYDMEKSLRNMAFEKLKRLQTINVALQKQLASIVALTSTDGANTAFDQDQKVKIADRCNKTMEGLYEAA